MTPCITCGTDADGWRLNGLCADCLEADEAPPPDPVVSMTTHPTEREAAEALVEELQTWIDSCGEREPGADECPDTCPLCGRAQRVIAAWWRAVLA